MLTGIIIPDLIPKFSSATVNSSLSQVPHLRTLTALPPPQINVFTTLAWVALLVVIVGFGAALALRKRRKLILIVTLVLTVAIVVAGFVWFLRADIYYSFDAVQAYPRVGDNYFTVNCVNTGYVAGSFSLDVKLYGAVFSSNTSQPYTLLDNSDARFDYTLQPGERQSTQVFFQISDNVTDFNIQLQHEQNNDFLMTSDSNGNTFMGFVKEPVNDAFTSQGAPVPP
jgi:hypothetical protein